MRAPAQIKPPPLAATHNRHKASTVSRPLRMPLDGGSMKGPGAPRGTRQGNAQWRPRHPGVPGHLSSLCLCAGSVGFTFDHPEGEAPGQPHHNEKSAGGGQKDTYGHGYSTPNSVSHWFFAFPPFSSKRCFFTMLASILPFRLLSFGYNCSVSRLQFLGQKMAKSPAPAPGSTK